MNKVRILYGYRSAATNEQYIARGLYSLDSFPFPGVIDQLVSIGEAAIGSEDDLQFIRYYYDHYTQRQLKSQLSSLGIESHQIQREGVSYVSKMDYVLALKKRLQDIEQRDMDTC